MFRDKEGKAVSREELEAARKAELEKKAKERETPEWAAGLRQQRDAAERRAAMAAEAAKPFARSRCASHQPWQTSWHRTCRGLMTAMASVEQRSSRREDTLPSIRSVFTCCWGVRTSAAWIL